MPTLGVVIGRFQVDQLTDGHLALLDHVSQRNTHMLVLVGDRNSPATATNPLSFAQRRAMILEDYSQAFVMPVDDHQSNAVWSKKLDNLIWTVQAAGPYGRVTLYCGRDGFAPHYSGHYPVTPLNFGMDGVSATARREWIAEQYDPIKDKATNPITFRRGIIHSMMHLPHRIYLTVDIACTRKGEDGNLEICMGQREWEAYVWRLPGGFVEKDESFHGAARREFQEETSAWIEGVDIVGDFPINDWRLRGATGVSHKTILCHGAGWGNIKADDDVARVEWKSMVELIGNPELVVPEHRDMFFKGLVPYLQCKKLL
jgi:bifunctional NMN adenylyltransferase/nudix hydrolase